MKTRRHSGGIPRPNLADELRELRGDDAPASQLADTVTWGSFKPLPPSPAAGGPGPFVLLADIVLPSPRAGFLVVRVAGNANAFGGVDVLIEAGVGRDVQSTIIDVTPLAPPPLDVLVDQRIYVWRTLRLSARSQKNSHDWSAGAWAAPFVPPFLDAALSTLCACR